MNRCEKWLFDLLSKEDSVLCDIVRAESKIRGFSRRQLKEARKSLGVKTFHQFDEYGPTPNWFWYLD